MAEEEDQDLHGDGETSPANDTGVLSDQTGQELEPVDVEAENSKAAAEGRELDEALAEDAKVDLDGRLKKAADEAKAKGKKTIRTFDMLRKAISGDPEQRKKQEQEEEKKRKDEESKQAAESN